MVYTKDMPNIKNDELTTVGNYTYGPLQIGRLYGGTKVDIGKFCSFASGIQIMFLGRHAISDSITSYPFYGLHSQGWPAVMGPPIEGQNVTIGNDVWIATGATIMQGAEIGDGAIIGAYSVVKTKVEPYSVYVGNPAKKIKQRFPDAQIEKLLEIRWWDWPIEKIKEHLQVISNADVSALYYIWESEIKNT